MKPIVVFAALVPLYLLPVLVAYRSGLRGRAQLFICGSLFVSLVLLLPVVMFMLSANLLTLSAGGTSLVVPWLLWFAAFAAACLAPAQPVAVQ